LKAAMFRLEARPWPAPPACDSTRICSGATVAKAAAPRPKAATTAPIRSWKPKAEATSTRVRMARLPSRAGARALSAQRPPTRLPPTRPAPNTSRIGETAAFEKPASSVRIGWM
jgi:hypothetical protein